MLPSNDICENAEPLVLKPRDRLELTIPLGDATVDSEIDPNTSCGPYTGEFRQRSGLWYTITGYEGRITITLETSFSAPRVFSRFYACTGDCNNNLACIELPEQFNAMASETYWLYPNIDGLVDEVDATLIIETDD